MMKLLLVSANPRSAFQLLLETHFALTLCPDLNAALALCLSLQPALLLTDSVLTDGDGFELCRSIRRHPELPQTRVVVITENFLTEEDHTHSLRVGASRLLARSIAPDLLLQALTEVAQEPGAPLPEPAGTPEHWRYLQSSRLRIAAEYKATQTRKNLLKAQIDEYQKNQNQLEQSLRHAQRLSAIGAISSGVAHDFNNILCGIIGLSEIGLRMSAQAPYCHRNFEDIRTASHRAANLVRAILSFSRRQEQPRGPIFPSQALTEVLAMLRATIPSFIEIAEDISGTPAQILGEISQFQQILTNLVLNAAHAIGNRNGRIAVKIHLAIPPAWHLERLPKLHKKPYICLEVVDNGSGIEPGNLERIFEPFYTTKPSGQGTGLGLWVTRGIVESWDGTMTVDSSLGAGTTFSLYFPQAHESSESMAFHIPSLPVGHGQRILFVDEEALLGSVMTQSLVAFGYIPTAVQSAEAAMEQVQSHEFDAVLTDLNMPGMNGIDLARALWKIKPQLPILLTTGHIDHMDEAMAQSLGFRTLLPKPFDSRTLAQTLHTVLG